MITGRLTIGIHKSIDPIIINIASDDDSEDSDDDVFLDSDNE